MWTLFLPSVAIAVSFDDRSDQIPVEIVSLPYGGDGKMGCGLLDGDGDGDLDLYLANGPTQPNLLYRNEGDGTFTEVGQPSGAGVLTGTSGVLAADLDGDGATDLVLSGDGGLGGLVEDPVRVLHNDGDGTFTDVSATAGITGAPVNFGASAADIDGDGDLDVFIPSPGSLGAVEQYPNTLWRNNGDGTFTEIAELAGVAQDWGACSSTFTHLDDDDAIDLIVANCNDVRFAATPFEVYRNDGDGTFTDVTAEVRVWGQGYWMGLAVADFDGDGLLDIFSTNLGDTFHHALYFASPDGRYEDRADEVGVGAWEFGWGTVAADLDNDTDVDLYYVGTSRRGATEAGGFVNVSPGHLFLNEGDGTFAAPEQPVDLTPYNHTGLCQGDLDGNGFPDLVVMITADPRTGSRGQPLLLMNQGNDNHWLTVRLLDEGSNPAAIGARIRASVDGVIGVRELQAGSSFLSTSTPWPTFGLGAAEEAHVCVRWPDGVQEDFGCHGAGQRVELSRGAGTPGCALDDPAPPDASVDTGTTPTPPGPPAGGGGTDEVRGGCGCATRGGPGAVVLWLGLPLLLRRRRRP